MELDLEAMRRRVLDAVLSADFRAATFAGPARGGDCPWRRIAVRPVELRGERWLQFSYFDGKKDITKNHQPAEATEAIAQVLDFGFSAVHLSTRDEETDIRVTKKGKILLGRRKADPTAPALAHNRRKDLPLPEGKADRLLEAMGILTRGGAVRPTMRAKYMQINEFLKHLTHVLNDAGLHSLNRPLRILDCGCGSSYLTLATHHYLNGVLGIPAEILGVDVNEEVIKKSMARAERLGAPRLNFTCSPIDAVTSRPDIVLALHACDTATDDAIAQAIAAEATVVLSVPCCHHHLNDQLRAEGPAEILRPILRHGILRERTADLVTDAFRAHALRIMGYRSDVVEFISPEHTARNLMIRAVRAGPAGDARHVREYIEMKRFWGVTPYIEQAIGEPLGCLLRREPPTA